MNKKYNSEIYYKLSNFYYRNELLAWICDNYKYGLTVSNAPLSTYNDVVMISNYHGVAEDDAIAVYNESANNIIKYDWYDRFGNSQSIRYILPLYNYIFTISNKNIVSYDNQKFMKKIKSYCHKTFGPEFKGRWHMYYHTGYMRNISFKYKNDYQHFKMLYVMTDGNI